MQRSLRFCVLLNCVLLAFPMAMSNVSASEVSLRQEKEFVSKSFYVTMPDGVKLALDVYFPPNFDKSKKYPAVMELTRYWRGMVHPKTGKVLNVLSPIDKAVIEHGYCLVRVDVRGSGASFGTRQEEYGPAEVRDGYALVDWVANQSWSNGSVGAKGISYTGTTAELLAASNHPALKAVIPGWSDFDVYSSPGRPYGMFPSGFLQIWGKMVGMMDNHEGMMLGGNIRPVKGHEGELSGALQDHQQNPDVCEMVKAAECRDSVFGKSAKLEDCTSWYWREQIQKSNVPMLVFASWLDAGTAEGALIRLQNYSNPQKVVILASNHGGQYHASPFIVGRKPYPSNPTIQKQIEMRLDFLDHHLKDKKNSVAEWPWLQYFNLGEEAMKSSDTWPVEGTKTHKLFLNANHRLSMKKPDTPESTDTYQVDFGASTGPNNRWMTQMGEPVLNLNNRARMEKRMLNYTTEPLGEDLQITGAIVARLSVASTHEDGAVFVYVSAIDTAHDTPEGKQPRSRYLTEGGLRLIHRKVATDPDFVGTEPFHSFRKADVAEMEPGTVEKIEIRMHPTSVRLKKGQRIRFSIAGHDDSVFDRVPEEGEPVLTIHRGRDNESWIELPVLN